MEALLEAKSIPLLLILIVVFLCATFIKGLVEFLWKVREKKDSASESAINELTEVVKKNTLAMELLDRRLDKLEIVLSEIPKFKLDMRKYYSAIKILAGDKWPSIRKEIEEENAL